MSTPTQISITKLLMRLDVVGDVEGPVSRYGQHYFEQRDRELRDPELTVRELSAGRDYKPSNYEAHLRAYHQELAKVQDLYLQAVSENETLHEQVAGLEKVASTAIRSAKHHKYAWIILSLILLFVAGVKL